MNYKSDFHNTLDQSTSTHDHESLDAISSNEKLCQIFQQKMLNLTLNVMFRLGD